MKREASYMNLEDISDELSFKEFFGKKNINVSGISYDSRTVKPGDIFVAIKGLKEDGHKYVKQAIASGASTIILERMIPSLKGFDACFVVDSGR